MATPGSSAPTRWPTFRWRNGHRSSGSTVWACWLRCSALRSHTPRSADRRAGAKPSSRSRASCCSPSAGCFPRYPPTGPRIAVVQTNLPQNNKLAWDLNDRIERFRTWASLSAEAGAMQPPPHLIVWPETMFPGATLSPEAITEFERFERSQGRSGSIGTLFVAPLLELQDQIRVPMLLGAIGYDKLAISTEPDGGLRLDRDASYNSAFLLAHGRIDPARYDKIFLTPFGETMPYISAFPALERALLDFAAGGMNFDLSAGTVPVRFEVETEEAGTLRIATPICFEATIAHVCRRLVYDDAERQADMLVNLTNDGWFGSFDAGRANHLLIARWRAIELGTPIVRAANTGISCVVDARGRVLKAAAPRQPADLLPVEVPLPGGAQTIYARIGDVAGWLATLATLALLGFACWTRRFDRESRDTNPSEPKPSPRL
ncbi:MAG: apolipoprotein N-acyltransferase [Phycisphaerales bacterium]